MAIKQEAAWVRSRAKTAIVQLALWGLLPAKVAEWIIRRGGLRDA